MTIAKRLFLISALFPLLCCKQETVQITPALTTQIELVDGKSVELLDAGEGNQTYVFIHGLGGDINEWIRSNIAKEIAATNQVIAYNRAGYGNSEPASDPRSFAQMAEELDQLIEAFADRTPVILVSHAWGASLARAYAILHREKVHGTLMLDPVHEDMFRPYDSLEVAEYYRLATAPGALVELAAFEINLQYLTSLPTMPDMPTTILTAYGPINNLEIRFEAHRSLGAGISSSALRHYTVEPVGHQIHLEDPDLIIEELFAIVARIR